MNGRLVIVDGVIIFEDTADGAFVISDNNAVDSKEDPVLYVVRGDKVAFELADTDDEPVRIMTEIVDNPNDLDEPSQQASWWYPR